MHAGYMGFYHLAREVWLVDLLAGRTLVGVCDGSGEDARCHNSMCHLGLCSSCASKGGKGVLWRGWGWVCRGEGRRPRCPGGPPPG